MEPFLTFKRKVSLGTMLLLVALNIFTWREVFFLSGSHYLKVEVLDVGQGDSIFIETPAMRRIVIDGGPNSSVLAKLAERLPFWERRIDMVILTHPDSDHVMGLLSVLQKYQVDYIVWTGIVREGANYEKWIELVDRQKAQGAKIISVNRGDVIKSGGAELSILHPFEDLAGQFFKQTNDTGIVLRLAYGQKSFLLAADISSQVESRLAKGVGIASDVLKVSHHGSKYSSSEVFLRAINPSLAAISAGRKNSYGHPTPEVLQRLEEFGIQVLRTDRDKDITFLSDGKYINLK